MTAAYFEQYEEDEQLDYLNLHLDGKCDPKECIFCDEDFREAVEQLHEPMEN